MIVGFLTLAGFAAGTLVARARSDRRDQRLLAYLLRGHQIASVAPPTIAEINS